jgi:hypothetical protein
MVYNIQNELVSAFGLSFGFVNNLRKCHNGNCAGFHLQMRWRHRLGWVPSVIEVGSC